jgi:nicotinamidase-related amidase
MVERVGEERLLEMLLAGAPDRVVDAVSGLVPEDAAAVSALREGMTGLGLGVAPVAPPASLRERILASRPRPQRPRSPVVIVCDMLNDHLTPGRPLEVPRARDIVPALKDHLAEWRSLSIPVIYVCDEHAPGDVDFRDWPEHAVEGSEGAAIWPDLAPGPRDLIVKKRTYSAFCGTDLGPLLDRMATDEIILTGCATEIQLFATAVDALQRGFAVKIPPDCQAGSNAPAEMVTLAALSTMPPFEPRYLRGKPTT